MEAGQIGSLIGTSLRLGVAAYLGYLFSKWIINKYKKPSKN